MSVATASAARTDAERETPAERLFQPVKVGRYNQPSQRVKLYILSALLGS